MTLQEKFDELVSKYSKNSYFDNKVMLYQSIFGSLQSQVRSQRKSKNTEKRDEVLKLAFLALKYKASAWAKREEKDFIKDVKEVEKKKFDLEYPDNPYSDIYYKYLLEEKESLGL
jgi:hypothetical protein